MDVIEIAISREVERKVYCTETKILEADLRMCRDPGYVLLEIVNCMKRAIDLQMRMSEEKDG